MKLIEGKKIAIVGGGPGGLTLAKLLQQAGADVAVYERDAHENARPQGATLDLHHESGLAALDAAGLMDAFKANYRPEAGYMRVLDMASQIRFDDNINGEQGFHRPEIDRGPLNEILYQSLQAGTVMWDRQFAELTRQNDGIAITFKNGKIAMADIVIGADGANSRVRPFVTDLKPLYSGNMVVEGVVYDSAINCPKMYELLHGGKIFALGNSQMIVLSSKGDGSLVFYMGCKLDEAWPKSGIDFGNREGVIAWFKQEYAGWSADWLELFNAATLPFVPRPQYCMPLDKSWQPLPDLTLIGDAAHVMPPYAGEGVNMAMLDALELSRHLLGNEHESVAAAIAAYEEGMHLRFAAVGQETMDNTVWMHSSDGLQLLLDFFGGIPERIQEG